jgi:LacI family transcriptional regulator, repressor for deo operon, udp, cdd, tsx, nupC, and nupG
MNVSIKDIAKAAGVSHSTVSRALTNTPLVAFKTRRRIERIAHNLGYTPNAIARGLVTRRTRAIGVIVTTIADPFVAQVVRGIEEVAGDQRYRVFLCNSHSDPDREVNLVKALQEWRVDGVIVASSRVGSMYLPLLKKIRVPIVLINNQHTGRYIHSVAVDNILGGKIATSHLISLGHRTIAYVGGPADHAANSERLAGYRQALSNAKIAYDRGLVLTGTGMADGGEQVIGLVKHSPNVTALVCYNDMTAIGAMHALKRSGKRIPGDISIVGFDDIAFATYVDPPLTTIHQPKDELGRLAMRMLLGILNSNKVANTIVPVKLIERESTAANQNQIGEP